MSGSALQYSNELCYELEKDYGTDSDIKDVLRNGITPVSLLEAAKIIKRKENSRLIKLPVDLNAEISALSEGEIEYKSINDLAYTPDDISRCSSLKNVLKCVEASGGEDIMLKVQAPFSCLLSAVGSNNLFRWLYKYEEEVKRALDRIVYGLANYIIKAIDRGVCIISLADPSGMTEVLGEKLYKKYAAAYTVKLLKMVEPKLGRALVHLCPRTSIMLEKYDLISSEVFYYCREDYSKALIELSLYENIRFIGHRCINAEHTSNDKMYKIEIMCW